ncbi:MAG TPA: phosphate-starvation-inducible PsiE family protein [Nitrospiraceae bacterium]|nr:phosphate-starvation-inducible PsiE family protein [Nitrospiraceae bacterium]
MTNSMPLSSMQPLISRAAGMDLTAWWIKGIKLVLSLLILTILLALTGGVIKTLLDLTLLLHNPVEVALRQIIIDTLILLAVVEVFKTTLTYFSEGRVKVTFIVDTILVVMLTEVISEWFKGVHVEQFAILGVILLALAAIRVLAVRFSPTHGETAADVL